MEADWRDNPSYFGGWDLEDCDLRTTQENSSWDPISKITRAKGLEVWFKWKRTCFVNANSEFKSQSHKKRILLKTESWSTWINHLLVISLIYSLLCAQAMQNTEPPLFSSKSKSIWEMMFKEPECKIIVAMIKLVCACMPECVSVLHSKGNL
jgi:hypothetical protein